MLRSAILAAATLLFVSTPGCNPESPATPETPKAGPANEPDPGPAPSGQSEPATTQNAPAPSGQAALGAESASEGAASGNVQAVAFAETETEAKVDVQIMDWNGVEKLIASHQGKVVVVDMWSLSCAPCRREFPNLVKLHNDKSDQVACISISTDYAGIKSKPPESYKPKVLEFLTEQQATFENVLCSVESDELFDKLSLASIPAVYVYGKDGQLAQRFTGEEVHYDKEVLPLVDALLSK